MPILLGYILVPMVFIVLGILQLKYPPKDVNSFVGFRTRKSSKTKRNWDLAQQLCGQYLVISGIISGAFFALLALVNTWLKLEDATLEYLLLFPVFLLFFIILLIQKKLPD